MPGKVTKIVDLPPFRVGDVFPPDLKTAALVRFIVTAQPLLTVARLIRTKNSGEALDQVDGEQMLLASTADTKEAMDAFRDADSRGCLASIEAATDEDMKKRLRRLRRHSDPARRFSSYPMFIKFARDKAGGHWNRQRVLEELDLMKDEKVPIWIGDRVDGAASSGFNPLAHSLALRMSGLLNVSREKQIRRLRLLSKLQGDLIHVAGAAYTLALRDSYAKRQWE